MLTYVLVVIKWNYLKLFVHLDCNINMLVKTLDVVYVIILTQNISETVLEHLPVTIITLLYKPILISFLWLICQLLLNWFNSSKVLDKNQSQYLNHLWRKRKKRWEIQVKIQCKIIQVKN